MWSAASVSRRGGTPCEVCGRRGVGGKCGYCSGQSQHEESSTLNGHPAHSPPSVQQVKVALIGSHGVGKTALIKQFVSNEFPDTHFPTKRRTSYYPSVLVNDQLYQLTVADIPPIRSFPQNSFVEWAEFRHFGLRSSSAFIFVFDLTRPETFAHIKTLRDQLSESRDIKELGILVIGNKRDLLQEDGSEPSDYSVAVRKHWKASYLEVSAKFNWHVMATFREVLLSLQEARGQKDLRSHELSEVTDQSKCTIL